MQSHATPCSCCLLGWVHDHLRCVLGGKISNMDIIANRALTYVDTDGCRSALKVEFAKPEEDRGAWMCRYEISGAYNHVGAAYGGDSVQALMLALQAAGAHMNTPQLRGRVTMETLDGHGFPETPNKESERSV